MLRRTGCAAGVLPIGRVSAAAQQAKAPFHNLDVSPGQYELSTAESHQAPYLQVSSLLQLSTLLICVACLFTPLSRVYQHISNLVSCMQRPMSHTASQIDSVLRTSRQTSTM